MYQTEFYRPSEQDMRVGLICEVAYDQGAIWKEITLDYDSLHEYLYFDKCILLNEIRIPYLRHDDIVRLGWNPKSDILAGNKDIIEKVYSLEIEQGMCSWVRYTLYTIFGTSKPFENLVIHRACWDKSEGNYGEDETIFDGTCRCINDLKTIMKTLNIRS